MFNKIIVANRGAIAARVLRALNEMGVASVAVYSEADAGAPYLELASETYAIGAAPPAESYLNQDALLDVVRKSGADGVHPGYGFLAENPAFAQKVNDSGARFIDPSPRWIEAMGHKTKARELAAQYGMPLSRGSGVLPADPAAVLAAARE
ncbi:MAG TPA: biotin carboxylase N-terminal domain-containing protein, partial [Burkholderiales bacterium]|nr:biotin carboxylase N-terminal domain-containing protein [Burkholderiales bacterium]